MAPQLDPDGGNQPVSAPPFAAGTVTIGDMQTVGIAVTAHPAPTTQGGGGQGGVDEYELSIKIKSVEDNASAVSSFIYLDSCFILLKYACFSSYVFRNVRFIPARGSESFLV